MCMEPDSGGAAVAFILNSALVFTADAGGFIMRQLLAGLVLALSSVAHAQPEATSPRAPQPYATMSFSQDAVEFPFKRWGDAILLDNVMVNGQGPYRFVLDTGAEGGGRVDSALVEKLKLPAIGQTTTVGLVDPNVPVTEHRLDSLQIGPVSFTGVEVLSRDYNADRPPGVGPIDGIIGFHLFREMLLTIDYPARKVILAKGALPEPNGTSILPIVSDDTDPEVEITVAGHQTKALIDTGAMTFMAIPKAIADTVTFSGQPRIVCREPTGDVTAATLDGVVRIGELEFPNPTTISSPSLNQSVVGIRIIAMLRLTFDQVNARIRFERPPERKRYGIAMAMRPDASGPDQMREVTPGGIADIAGIKATDKVISINGLALPDMTREQYLNFMDAPEVTVVVERDGQRLEFKLEL